MYCRHAIRGIFDVKYRKTRLKRSILSTKRINIAINLYIALRFLNLQPRFNQFIDQIMFLTYSTKDKVLLFVFLLSISSCFAQVGINTTLPQGALDVNSSTQGIVLPRVVLQSTVDQAPIVNPKAGVTVIPIGTVVYNTVTTTNGTNDVSPGMYSWDGTKWNIEFTRNQSELIEQTSVFAMRTSSSAGAETVAGINGTFTPKFTGKYRIKLRVNYGGSSARVPDSGSDGFLNVARASGMFIFNFGSDTYRIPAHAYSTAYNSSEGATNYFAIWQEYTTVFYVNLTADDDQTYILRFNQDDLPDYLNDGDSNGRGHVGYDIPCTFEITYIGD